MTSAISVAPFFKPCASKLGVGFITFPLNINFTLKENKDTHLMPTWKSKLIPLISFEPEPTSRCCNFFLIRGIFDWFPNKQILEFTILILKMHEYLNSNQHVYLRLPYLVCATPISWAIAVISSSPMASNFFCIFSILGFSPGIVALTLKAANPVCLNSTLSLDLSTEWSWSSRSACSMTSWSRERSLEYFATTSCGKMWCNRFYYHSQKQLINPAGFTHEKC